MKQPTKCIMIYRVFLASLGILTGISAGLSFGIIYHNYDATVWGAISGVVACVSLWLHVTFTRGELVKYKYDLPAMMMAGCFIQLAGVCGFTSYIVLAVREGQGLTAEGPSYYLASVWTFMTWKWGFLLLYYARYYRNYFDIYPNYSPTSNDTTRDDTETARLLHPQPHVQKGHK